jgi:nitrite reductase/ring-hydroxylating ferredoxin subunit
MGFSTTFLLLISGHTLMKSNAYDEKRREFLKTTGSVVISGLTLTVLSPLLSSCEKDEQLPTAPPGSEIAIDLKNYPDLQKFPSIAKIKVTKPIETAFIIRRLSETEYFVFTATCPHQGAELNIPSDVSGDIHCPQHNVDFWSKSAPPAPGSVVANPMGVKVGSLRIYNCEFNSKTNILTIKLTH